MRWLSVMCLLAAVAACGAGEDDPAAGQPAAAPAEQVAAPAPAAAEPMPAPAPVPTQPQAARPAFDEPWTPTDTGTVTPGMTRAEVVAVWGEPLAERAVGSWTYLYYRNGCEVSCGTFDVVFLDNGQVVDAVVRGPGHTYAGVSSSPPDRPAAFTPPVPVPGSGTP